MKCYKFLSILLGTFLISFYSLCMEQPQDNRQTIISLIAIIKTQQNILGYIPPTDVLCIPHYFESFFEIMEGLDPKQERTKIYEQLQHREAINCINAIIYQEPFLEDRLALILERFGKNSIYFLQQTIKQNEKRLKKQQLFDYYQQITQEKLATTELPTTPITPKTSTPSKQPQEILEQLPKIKLLQKAVKDNEILFTQSTYQRITYNYQAYLYWNTQNLNCNIYDPFITVEVNQFDENDNLTFSNPNMPLPLPLLIDNNGKIKSKVFLPLSSRPFTVNYKNTEPLQNALPQIALNFYKNIGQIDNKDDIEYLLKANVIQKQGNAYIHGQNSCKPLLEEYFKLWNIPENDYQQEELKSEEQQIPQIQNPLIRLMIFARNSINNALNTIYNGIAWMLTKINIFKQ